MKQIIAVLCGLVLSVSAEEQKLTLDQALQLARVNSPELKAARLQTQAAEKAVGASGRWKNPLLNVTAEGVGGDLDGFNDTEYEIMLKQTFQRGGKQKSARAVAEKSIGIAFQAEARKELALLAEVRLAFISVFAQQEIGLVRVEQEQLGRAFVEVAKRKHANGGSSELEVLEAELALEEILLSQTCCFGDLKAARIRLASLIGISEAGMAELEGAYYDLPVLEETIIDPSHPSLRQITAQIEVAQAMAASAKAKDAADITLGAGYKYEAAEDVNTFVLGASMPLNFVRAGKAEQASIMLQAEALQAQQNEVRRQLQERLSMLIALYNGAKTEAEMTRDNLTPKAERAYELSRAGYDAGRFSWYELINAQQHLAEIRVRYIEALQDAHVARAEVSQFLQEGI
ncbi:TolC family protein [Pontiellaceae bacterium B12227]|nr:TolC family protein [Pontiellaceae bacterium B12227]